MLSNLIIQTMAAFGCGAVVGVALGLTGGGGSIFAVPLLIYVLGTTPAQAIPISLVAVAATALVGALQSIRHGLVVWQPSIMFAAGGAAGAPGGIAIGRLIDPQWVVAGFAALALGVGLSMWYASRSNPKQATAIRAQAYASGSGPICVLAPDGQLRFSAPCALVLALVGIGTGFLSGLFGVGGGFLIVPALVFITRMGVHRAVATSLLIISVIGFSGSASAVWHGALDWLILLPFAAGGAVTMITSRLVAARLAGPLLQRIFAVSIVLLGIAMLVESAL